MDGSLANKALILAPHHRERPCDPPSVRADEPYIETTDEQIAKPTGTIRPRAPLKEAPRPGLITPLQPRALLRRAFEQIAGSTQWN